MKLKKIFSLLPILILLIFLVQTNNAKANTSGFWSYEVYKDGTVGITGYSGLDEEIQIPSKIEGKTVVKIAKNAFKNNANIKVVKIPSTVTTIGHQAFAGSTITTITIPSTVTTWEIESSDRLPSGSYIYNYNAAFAECNNLKTVVIETETIPKGCFYKCAELTTVTLGKNTKYIEDLAFTNNTKLNKINVQSDLLKVGYYSFRNCESLSSISLGNKLTSIGYEAFAASGLTSITIPDTVTTWGYDSQRLPSNKYFNNHSGAFVECAKLKTVIFNSETIPSACFYGCDELTTVTLGKKTKYIEEYAFTNNTKLNNVTVKSDLLKIGSYSFTNCGNLTYMPLGTKLISMGFQAFAASGLKSAIIPNTVTTWEMGDGNLPSGKWFYDDYNGAFAECPNLKSLYLGNVTIPTNLLYNTTNVTMYCIKDSNAFNYAIENNITYKTYNAIPSTSIKLSAKEYTLVLGETLQLHPVLTPANSTDTVSWTSGNESIATVDSTGCVKAKTTGLVAIKCTTTSGKTYTCSINIVNSGETTIDNEANNSLSLATITGISNKEYTGSAITHNIKVKYNECTELIENVHYKVSYKNNVKAGVATVTITGISGSGFTGTVNKTFNIYTYTGMRKINDTWYYLIDSVIATNYIGMAQNEYGWFYIKNGKVDSSYTGMCKHENEWWYIKNGKLDNSFTGLAKNQYGWFYMKNGKLDNTYTGLAKNQYGWFYVKNGKLDNTYTGMAKNQYGWFYVTKGKLDNSYTGMAKNEYGWWYINKGQLDKTYTGLAKNQYGWFYMKNGKLDNTYTGMAKNQYGWFYVTKGKLDSSFTGIAKNSYGKWYMKNGKLASSYSGTVKYNGVTYKIKNGKVV